MESHQPSPPVACSCNLGLFTITFIGVGAMIGAGIFMLIATAGMLVVQSDNVIAAILQAVAYFDVLLDTTHELLFERMWFGGIPELVAALCNVILVKRVPHPPASSFRQMVLVLANHRRVSAPMVAVAIRPIANVMPATRPAETKGQEESAWKWQPWTSRSSSSC